MEDLVQELDQPGAGGGRTNPRERLGRGGADRSADSAGEHRIRGRRGASQRDNPRDTGIARALDRNKLYSRLKLYLRLTWGSSAPANTSAFTSKASPSAVPQVTGVLAPCWVATR